jgi:hypothetical protein
MEKVEEASRFTERCVKFSRMLHRSRKLVRRALLFPEIERTRSLLKFDTSFRELGVSRPPRISSCSDEALCDKTDKNEAANSSEEVLIPPRETVDSEEDWAKNKVLRYSRFLV